MATIKGFIHAAGTTALDTRKADAFRLVADDDASTTPRVGVLTDNPSIVTANGSTAPMRVAVARAGFATSRSVADGIVLWGNDGTVYVTITAPVTNSHIVVIYAKHNDEAAGDADSLPVLEAITGVAGTDPTEPVLPAGALKLATVRVPSTATASTSEGVIITNTYPMTAWRGGVVPLRDQEDQDGWTPRDGNLAVRLDTGASLRRSGGVWAPVRVLNHRFARPETGDASVSTGARIGLVSGTIVDAQPGVYRVNGRASLYATGGAVGYMFIRWASGGGADNYEDSRNDLPGGEGAAPRSPSVERTIIHPGGNLVIEIGYWRNSGTFSVTGSGSGLTVVEATYLGPAT